MDELDLRITDLSQRDGRTSNADLARELGVSEGTVRRRVGRLIQEDDEDRNDVRMDKKGGLRLKSLFCWRYLGLTGIERLAYDVAVSVGLTTMPEAS